MFCLAPRVSTHTLSELTMADIDNENEDPIQQASDADEGMDLDGPAGLIYSGMCKMLFPTDPNFEEKWAKIWNVMESVLADRPVDRADWNDVFIHIYQLCNAIEAQTANEFYDRVRKAIERHIDGVYEILAQLSDKDFFHEFHIQCAKIEKISKYLNTLLGHLNQHIEHNARELHLFALIHDGQPSKRPLMHVDQLITTLWREKILDTSVCRIASIILDQFDNHRAGKPVENPSKLKEVIQYFIDADETPFDVAVPFGVTLNHRKPKLSLYHSGIEKPLKKSCFKYNNEKLKEWSTIASSIDYINNVAELMESEKNFANLILHPTTSDAIETWVAETLVNDKIIDSKLSFRDQMTRENFNEAHLKRCFNVLKLIPNGVDNLCHDFGAHVAEILAADVESNANDPKLFVTACSALCERFYGIVKRVFYGHRDFTAAVDKAVRTTVNLTIPGQIKPGDKVARFADQYLRKPSTSEDDTQLDNFATVLKFVTDKEQFEKTYQVLLANRLLGRVTASVPREMQAVEKMRGICTAEFVQRCNRMCLDVERSATETAEFKKKMEREFKKPTFDDSKQAPIDITILQTGSWPLQIGKEEHGPATPLYLIDTLQCFTNHYTKLHSGRQLNWAPSLSTVDVRLTYLERPYTITMTAIHFDILMCFEDVDVYSVSDLAMKAKLMPDFLKRYGKPLVDNGILTMSKPDDWSPETLISLNHNFNRKNNKMRLPIPMTNRPLKHDIRPEVTGDQSDANRQYLDSIIVRELKRLKMAKHGDLYPDVSKIVNERFVMTNIIFKKSIESLIDRGYVKRGETMDEYHYIA
uniref:CULLIN_2 domain-containing protein n=1 Tax=Panagrellus redivivus TaxID=6233 RepID=A0A7E4ZUD3_PANRE